MLVRFALLTFSIVAVLSTAVAGEWTEFRGPGGDGHAPAAPLPLTWSESEGVAWKTAIPGRGWSSPVVLEGQIWLTTATDQGRSLRAIAVDAATGSIVHQVEVFREAEALTVNEKNSHASPSPVIEPGRVYVHFGTLGTACLSTETGGILWTNRELLLDHKEGPGSSPVIWNDLILLNCDGMDVQYVAALDKSTGQLVWKTERSGELDPNPDFRKAYSTPLVVHAAGRDQWISVGADQTIAYDPRTGEELWVVRYKGFSNVPRPVFAHDLVYLVTSYNRPELWAVALDGRGDVTSSHVRWTTNQQVPSIPTPIVVGDWMFFVSNRGVATCLDARTGEMQWRERLGGNFAASPIVAGDRVYASNESGETFVFRASPQFELLTVNRLNEGLMATPAVTEGAILLRTLSQLYRIEDRASASR